MNFLTILGATVSVFLIIAVGYVTRLVGMVNDQSEKSVMRIIVNVLYPCFILSKIPGNEALKEVSIVAVAFGVGFLLTVTGLGVARSVGLGLRIDKEDGLNTFCVATAIQNYGFIPIPLIIAFFGDSADETLGVLFVHNLGLEMALWTIGIVLLSGTMTGAAKRLVNGPTIAITLGLILNFTGLYEFIPGFVATAMKDLGNCSIPIGLLLVGAALAGVIQNDKWTTNWPVISGAMLIRFVIMPILFLASAAAVGFSPELKRVLIIESAMPAAAFPIVLSKHFGGKPSIAVQVCLVTSIASLVMTPVLLMIALKWFGIETADTGAL